jgi:hypothetical protein
MLATADAAWEDLQAKSWAGTMNILNLILLYTFLPSPMIFAKNKVLQTIFKSHNLHASNSSNSCSMGSPSS